MPVADHDAGETTLPRFYIYTLGCKVNQAESELISASLLSAGWMRADTAADADVIILNSCTVTGEADAKNRKAIRSLLRAGNAPLIVTGCAININAGHYADIDARVICEPGKHAVPSLAAKLANGHAVPSIDELEHTALRGQGNAGFRTRVDLKIQDGCDNACTYCIVHVARGPARSVPAEDILAQARTLCAAGTRELVLVGIDLAAYEDGRVDLARLVDTLLAQTTIGRIRISSVEPQSVTSSLIDALARSDGRLCRHLHLCLQSGSSKVLHEMNRHYDAREFAALIARMRDAVPQLALSTDVIVGFPGETDDDFEESYRLIEQCGFMRLHVFRYSKRPGTPAAIRSDQIAPEVKARRSQALIELGERLALADMERRLKRTEQVIIERPGLGTSESYHAVACDATIPVGELIELEFTDIDTESMRLIAR